MISTHRHHPHTHTEPFRCSFHLPLINRSLARTNRRSISYRVTVRLVCWLKISHRQHSMLPWFDSVEWWFGCIMVDAEAPFAKPKNPKTNGSMAYDRQTGNPSGGQSEGGIPLHNPIHTAAHERSVTPTTQTMVYPVTEWAGSEDARYGSAEYLENLKRFLPHRWSTTARFGRVPVFV